MRNHVPPRTAALFSSVLVLLLATATSASTAETPPRLEPGSSVERSLAASESQDFRVDLAAGQFLYLTVDQRGIDVIVRLHDPEGERVLEVDQAGTEGLESVSFFTRVAGNHRIEVVPYDDEAEPGRFAIEIVRLEPAAATPGGKVDQMMAPWDSLETPGASLVVVRDGKVVLRRGYGSAQLEYDIPISPSTVFHVASVSKQFTAYAIAMLAAEGKLSLDDDVRQYLPEVPDFGKKITLRHLVHHTSGLRDQWNLLAMGGWRLDDVITLEHILTAVSHQEELNFDPGEEMVYCNTGYTLLAEVVARLSGQSFREWTTENLFEPLGMNHTHFHDDHEMIVPNRAYSYSIDGSGFKKRVLSYANVGATSLFTTVDDLARWGLNLERGTLGGEAILKQVHQRGKLNNGEEVSYAFGLVHGEHRGLKTVGHGGGDAGFRSQVVRYPDQSFAVAVLSNLGSFNPGGIARRIAEVYLEEEMAAAEPRPEQPPAEEPQSEETVENAEPSAGVEIDPEVLEACTGKFRLDVGLLITVTRDGDQLYGQAQGQPRFTLAPLAELEFRIREVDAHVTFHRGETGDVERLTLFQGGREMPGRRLEPFDPTAEQLAVYVGRYYSPELGTSYSVAIKEDRLIALHRRHGEIELSPTEKDEFSADAWYFRQVKFERDEHGSVKGMRASSGRVRNVRFERQPD